MTNLVVAILMTCSWERFDDAGKIAANHRPFNPAAMTCATRRFPVGSLLSVRDHHNGSSIQVRVTDIPNQRFANRIDLSPAAFQKLNGLALGICRVEVTPISIPSQNHK